MKDWSRGQRTALVVGLIAVAIALVLFLTPVGSAAQSRASESSMVFCGSVISAEHDSGDCGTRLAERRTAGWIVLVGGVVAAVGGVWALRSDDVDLSAPDRGN